jgi:hypothetical protein
MVGLYRSPCLIPRPAPRFLAVMGLMSLRRCPLPQTHFVLCVCVCVHAWAHNPGKLHLKGWFYAFLLCVCHAPPPALHIIPYPCSLPFYWGSRTSSQKPLTSVTPSLPCPLHVPSALLPGSDHHAGGPCGKQALLSPLLPPLQCA